MVVKTPFRAIINNTDDGIYGNLTSITSGDRTDFAVNGTISYSLAPPPTFAPTDMATLNGTQENSITLLTGADLSGSFPYLAADNGSPGQNMITVMGLVNSANQWVGALRKLFTMRFPRRVAAAAPLLGRI